MVDNVNPKSFDPAEWITQAEAARLRQVSRQAIHRLIERGKLSTLEVAGNRLVKRSDVEAFEPEAPGRPSKGGDVG